MGDSRGGRHPGRRGGGSPGATALLLLFGLPSLWAPGPRAVHKGNEALRKADYARATAQYSKAAEALPAERAVPLAMGTAFLAQKKTDEALRNLLVAAGDKRPEVKSRALYNSGEALFAAQKLPESLAAYREAILADPADMDAKYNYELVERKLKGQQGKNQPKNQNDKNKQDKNQKGQNQDQNAQQNQDQQQQQDQAQNQPQQPENPRQNQPKPGEENQKGDEQKDARPMSLLSKQEAERLLDALKESEMDMIKARLHSNKRRDVEKDW